jgi:IS30 family transposase
MSGKIVYNHIFFHMKRELKKLALKDLRLRGKARKKGSEGEKWGKTPGMTLIDTRPAEINARSAAGHWEGALSSGKAASRRILVTAKRKTIEKRFKRLKEPLRRSIIFDQRKENSERKEPSEHLAITVLFPPSPFAMEERDMRERQVSDTGHVVSGR